MHFVGAIDPMTTLQAIRVPGPYIWREKNENEGSKEGKKGRGREGRAEGQREDGRKKGREEERKKDRKKGRTYSFRLTL